MTAYEINLAPYILAALFCAIVFFAAALMVYNYLTSSKLTFSFKQLLYFVTVSALLSIFAGLCIRLTELGDLKVDVGYQSNTTIRD